MMRDTVEKQDYGAVRVNISCLPYDMEEAELKDRAIKLHSRHSPGVEASRTLPLHMARWVTAGLLARMLLH